jgi:hypothetical protein
MSSRRELAKNTLSVSSNKENNNVDKPVMYALTHCTKCKDALTEYNMIKMPNNIFGDNLPVCKNCLKEMYDNYVIKYRNSGFVAPENKALKRICMLFNLYYNETSVASAQKYTESNPAYNLLTSYLRTVKFVKNSNKTFDETIEEEAEEAFQVQKFSKVDKKAVAKNISDETIKFFGAGFSEEDYLFLKEQYDDWTARHECNTKSQEEMFKQICFTQLELLKANRTKQDTKDLNATFLKQLEAAKLQPKQNASETVADTQTFGTLIDKWENTRPIPEVEDSLKDVDKIGKYINIFFRGHLSKMVGIKNDYCKAYEDFMKKYSVKKPEYDSDGNSEALFDSIFGGDLDA